MNTVDVLTVMDGIVGRLVIEHDGCVNAVSFASGFAGESSARANEQAARARLYAAAEARAAVAELIEADREFDDARAAAAKAGKKTEYLKARERLQQAEQRRAAAIVRFGGAK